MHHSIIAPDQDFLLLFIMLAISTFGLWAERHTILGRAPGILWILLTGAAFSNAGIIPREAPVYDVILSYILPMAVPLLQFKARICTILRESRRVLITFFLGSATICVGGFAAGLLLDLGPIEPKIVATYVAAWIGGMVNMLAISQMTELTPIQFSVAISASAPVSFIGLALLCLLPSMPFVRKQLPSAIMDATRDNSTSSDKHEPAPSFKPSHIFAALTISALICTASHLIIESGLFPSEWRIGSYNLFIITILAIILANIFPGPLCALQGDFELGMMMMYLFFATIGIGTDIEKFFIHAPLYFLFGLIIIMVHLSLMLILTKIFRLDLAEVIIGSGANIVGPGPAAGIASSKGWRELVTPAIATGMLGYAVANFIGLAIYKFLG